MSLYKFYSQRDNAVGTLAAAFNPGDPSAPLNLGQGTKFGPIAAGDKIRVTFYHPASLNAGGMVVDPSMIATYGVYGVSGDNLLSPTFQKGNSTLVFPAGSVVARVITQDDFADLGAAINDLAASGTTGVVITSPNSTVSVGGTAARPTVDVSAATLATKVSTAGGDASATVVTAAGGAVARSAAAIAADVYNAKNFGAVADGAADDVVAIHRAIWKAVGSPGAATLEGGGTWAAAKAADAAHAAANIRYATRPVFLPGGDYKISEPINVVSVSGLHVYGCPNTRIIPPTTTVPYVFHVNGADRSVFSTFRIEGGSSLGVNAETITDCILFEWDPATAARSSSTCRWENIVVRNTRCVTAFRVGAAGSTSQVDTSVYLNLILNGYWNGSQTDYYQNGMVVGSNIYGNNLDHQVFAYNAVSFRYGIASSATKMSLRGGEIGACGTGIYHNTLNAITYSDIRFELCGRLLETPNVTSEIASNTTLSNILFTTQSLNSDKRVIKYFFTGTLKLENVDIEPQTTGAKVYFSAYRQSRLILAGVECATPPIESAPGAADGFLETNDRVSVQCDAYFDTTSTPVVLYERKLVRTGDFSNVASSPLGKISPGPEHVVKADCTVGPYFVQLPYAERSGIGRAFEVENIGTSNAPSISTSGANVIVGTYSLASQYKRVLFAYEGRKDGSGNCIWEAIQIR